LSGDSENAFGESLLKWRKDYFDRIIASKPIQKKFKDGWYNRIRKLAAASGVKSPV
jgi:hypothetical protein